MRSHCNNLTVLRRRFKKCKPPRTAGRGPSRCAQARPNRRCACACPPPEGTNGTGARGQALTWRKPTKHFQQITAQGQRPKAQRNAAGLNRQARCAARRRSGRRNLAKTPDGQVLIPSVQAADAQAHPTGERRGALLATPKGRQQPLLFFWCVPFCHIFAFRTQRLELS